ncbi:MAG: AAA family ATPase [Acidobacteriaceae bacterium]|nr:AAA family ATPase [Acidobacteriaceae bacterium]
MGGFPDFYGNRGVAEALASMIERSRIPQTILLSGPEGVGKATLARRFGAALLGHREKIERDDLSLPANLDSVSAREKWTSEKRADDPLFFSTQPDFVTFAPDGPLRQITIQQMRLLRERAQLKPLRGAHRVFLVDHLERANEQSANSLLKVLEEPPEHLVIIATTENLFDLLPTIRSRSIVFQMSRLSDTEMTDFARARELSDADARVALSEGCPGIAATLDLEKFRERRALMLTALECGASIAPFSTWIQHSEAFSARKSEKLEVYLKMGYALLQDVLRTTHAHPDIRNRDIDGRIKAISERVTFAWIERAVHGIDELVEMARRNIQKTLALDAFVINLRNPRESPGT